MKGLWKDHPGLSGWSYIQWQWPYKRYIEEKTRGEAMRQWSRDGGDVSTRWGTPGIARKHQKLGERPGWILPWGVQKYRPCPPLDFELLASIIWENKFLMFKRNKNEAETANIAQIKTPPRLYASFSDIVGELLLGKDEGLDFLTQKLVQFILILVHLMRTSSRARKLCKYEMIWKEGVKKEVTDLREKEEQVLNKSGFKTTKRAKESSAYQSQGK